MNHLFSSPRLKRLCLRVIVGAVAFACSTLAAGALELHSTRTSPFDLALRGRLAGLAANQECYVSWAELETLPHHQLKLAAEFFPGEQEVTAVFLDDVWRALPVAADADVILARCADGYAAVYRRDFINRYRPFLVLAINGLSPKDWPPPGLRFNPAPYVVTVSPAVGPGVDRWLDVNHKKPWGVTTLEFAAYRQAFHDALTGKWAGLSDRATQGREIWVNSCASCHAGPGQVFGGTKSGQPFAVLQAIAASNPAFFKLYVHDPKAANPAAHMEPHPHYSDVQLDALIAFITAEK